ncbi:MAG: hypothetical protein HYS39_01145 [Proteobacteria bacterium]|nr:hypothetical protein [Pseudomonadota bacterium]
MAISEVPAKIIERAESLSETKMHIAAELTKLVYEQTKDSVTEEKVFSSFKHLYDKIEKLKPQNPIEALTIRKMKKLRTYLILSGVFLLLIFLTIIFYFPLF